MLVAWVLLLRSTYLWPGSPSSGVNVALDQGVLGYQTNSKTIYTAFLWQDSRDFIGIAVILQWLRFIECVPPPLFGGCVPPPLFWGVCFWITSHVVLSFIHPARRATPKVFQPALLERNDVFGVPAGCPIAAPEEIAFSVLRCTTDFDQI